MSVISVSSLVRYLKQSVENDMRLRSLMVSGEISNFTHHRSGHLYFSLKDNDTKMNCVMFRTSASKLNLTLQEGMKVIITCSVSMYEPQGSIQLYVTKIQSDGLGDLYLAFEKLKKKLHEEGLFAIEQKKQLPSYPMNVGIISAKTGAAIQDVLSIFERRWPIAKLTLYPSLVQGESAAKDLIRNLKIADVRHHDIILLVRGGGSMEDLWCFNDEMLAREIYAMKTCVVSGVGHEVDTTLVDYVSDARAATPSAAAELVTPNIKDVRERLNLQGRNLISSITSLLEGERSQFMYYKEKPFFTHPDGLFKEEKMHLKMIVNRLRHSEVYFQRQQHQLEQMKQQMVTITTKYIDQNKERLQRNISLLDAYSPLHILKRGYSITSHENGQIVRSKNDVKKTDLIKIRLQDGIIDAEVKGE
ncbi:exodeoxyribonuclease VII large subunit [Breznakia sp. PF5-3]|uniref:exodeoxyribonuclease VII large subunit n=1 Tax=unclassified Breznakia TaxID=2623764 RepID=UPI002404B499|nr:MULTISPECIES: exodeoxyribonuclease VII large subunit [unclassified Breznakia]MDF9823909.1 exodeoxyribonuclease VII large subunit [Breznakia sp. PM6-1]MDF9834708.1 exodeoxyribonuclease VII large subunit [Breznakia sp. PF5-3]MDF9836857.1 exodeoxyribonuclease VII large subunit [Breznakia sp. PFB2-8]MDF9858874.1 exodeoxyribonuclease VII large subunit [Breznakia sp. PH5-24]